MYRDVSIVLRCWKKNGVDSARIPHPIVIGRVEVCVTRGHMLCDHQWTDLLFRSCIRDHYPTNSLYLHIIIIHRNIQNLDTKMTEPQRAICRIRFPPAIHEKNSEELNLDHQGKLRLKWADSIQELFKLDQEPQDREYPRNFDIILDMDGSAENYLQNPPASPVSAMLYPARYQLPETILEKLDTVRERISRAEHFALGSILYEVVSGHQIFHELGDGAPEDEAIQKLIAEGKFPGDLWHLPVTPTILGCFCPGFLEEMLSLRKTGLLLPPLLAYMIFPSALISHFDSSYFQLLQRVLLTSFPPFIK